MKIGDIVNGKVTRILSYGAFVKVDDYRGFVHIADFSDNYVKSIRQFVKVNQVERFKILDIDEDHKSLKLSYKLIHKIRGVRCELPEFTIGFSSLEKALPLFIKEKEAIDESHH